ncbi:hypothetical protein AAFC00_002324 [Neodothiora populina]|uniref:Uncharacterized protein n=1 Tax=Neodothiora populina TaxID=2781224 RepID=A0ABR3PH22_9PEZI
MPTWLNSQKKARLAELAEICKLGTPEELAEWRKDQLVPALETVLSQNTQRFSKVTAFAEYYQRRNSPIKRGSSAHVVNIPPALLQSSSGDFSRIRERIQATTEALKTESSQASEERASPPNETLMSPNGLSSPTVTAPAVRRALATNGPSSTISRTPARAQDFQEQATPAPLPPSPAIVTDLIEAQTARFNEEVGDLWQSTRIVEYVNQLRVELSSMVGVHMAILVLEFYYLQSHVTVWRFLFDINTPFFTKAVYYPDVFVYLTGYWLSMLATWQALSFWIPLGVSWICNLSLKLKNRNGVEYWRPRYRVDPVTFSVVKGVLAWLIYIQGARFGGLFSDETVTRVQSAMPAGFEGVAIASGVGVVMALWDGVQGKKGWQ